MMGNIVLSLSLTCTCPIRMQAVENTSLASGVGDCELVWSSLEWRMVTFGAGRSDS